MTDQHDTLIELPNGGKLRVHKTGAGARLEALDADGRFSGVVVAKEHCTLARLLRHGGTRVFGEYPVSVCVEGGGWLLSTTVTIPLPRDAALLAAIALDPEPDHLSPEGIDPRRDWPPHGYGQHETGSIYAADRDRFVVSLIVTKDDNDASTAEEAARAALDRTRSEGAEDTVWCVHDRRGRRRHLLAQRDFDPQAQ